jgi:hypothetical protein
MLEPCDGKLSRTVLRGEGSRKAPALPGATPERLNFHQIFSSIHWSSTYSIINLKEIDIMAEKQIWVYAESLWQRTGAHVTEGQSISFAEFSHGFRPVDPDSPYVISDVQWKVNPSHRKYYGSGGTGTTTGHGYVLPGESEGCLVFRIGDDGTPHRAIGSVTADRSGEIQLITNDDIRSAHGDGFSDNDGRLDIRITY